MPTIDELYLDTNTATVTHDLWIGPVRLENVSALQWDFAIAQVPTLTITLNGVPPDGIVFNASVRLDVGFEGNNVRVFTGRIVHINPNERQTIIECQGYSLWLDNNYHRDLGPGGISLTFENVEAEDVLNDLLEASGVPFY